MKNFCIVTNSYKDEKCRLAELTAKKITDAGGTCIIRDNADMETGKFQTVNMSEMPENLECVITIGGDGTLLHAAKDLLEMDVVFIGINKGTLGFLAEISPEDTDEALKRLMNDDFFVESRMMLKGEVIRDGEKIYESKVLNDIVAHRGGELTVTNYIVYVNGHKLGDFVADGIILSTPTGSTAYNLSAGGPVARPDSHMIVLTPICSHSMGSRSILLSEYDEIEIEIGECRKPNKELRRLVFDGDAVFNIVTGDRIRVSETVETTEIAKLDEASFLQVIKNKLK